MTYVRRPFHVRCFSFYDIIRFMKFILKLCLCVLFVDPGKAKHTQHQHQTSVTESSCHVLEVTCPGCLDRGGCGTLATTTDDASNDDSVAAMTALPFYPGSSPGLSWFQGTIVLYGMAFYYRSDSQKCFCNRKSN